MKPLKSITLITLSTGLLLGCVSTLTEKEIDRTVDRAIIGELPNTPENWDISSKEQTERGNWLNSFNDPVLVKLVNEALLNNKNLRASEANVLRARGIAVQAGASLLPAVNLAIGGGRSGSPGNIIGTSDSRSVSLQMNWEADVWGRVRSGEQAAIAGADAAISDFRFARQSIAAATIRAYVIAIEAGLQVDIARERTRILEETLRIVDVRFRNGLASSEDLALSRSDLAAAREQLIAIEGSQRDALRALEVLLGRYPGADLELRKSLPDIPASPNAGVPSQLLERRPDLVAADRRVAAAFNALEQAKAAQLPSLSLTSSVGGTSTALSGVLDSSNVAWQLGANLLAPIFDGGVRRAQVDIATAEQEQALAGYAQAALTAFQEVESALDLGEVLAKRETELKIAVEEANKAFHIAQLKYQEGESGLLDLLTIQQRVIGNKSNLAALQRLLLEQRVSLVLALGGQWVS